MWDDLPAHVIILIFSFLHDTSTRISASTTCRRWREVIFENSNVVLKDKQRVEFTCGTHGHCMGDEEVRMMLKFMPRIDTLILKWCVCKTSDLLQAVNKILALERLTIKQIHLNGNLSLDCKKIGSYLPVLKRKAETISSLVNICARLEVLDLGFEPDLSRNVDIMKYVSDKVKNGKLNSLNIAAIFPSIMNNPNEMCEKIDLNKLTTLSLNFDKHFKDLVDILSAGVNTETRLKQLTVVVSASFECNNVTEEMWENVMEYQEEMKLKLVLVEDNRCTDTAKLFEQIGNLPKNLNVHSLVFISNMYIIFHLASDHNLLYVLQQPHLQSHIEEFSLHYLESEFPETEMNKFAEYFIEPLRACKKLKKLHLCGLFIDDTEIMTLGTLMGKRLTEFVVYEKDVLTKSDVTGYFLPLAAAQVRGIEKVMTKVFRRDWKLVKTPHTNRSVKGKVQRHVEQVLHEFCSVTH